MKNPYEDFEASYEPTVTEPRRSERKRKPKVLEDFVTYMCESECVQPEDVPTTTTEALSRHDGEKWKQAMQEEMESFKENDTWSLVDPPEQGTIVDSKWVYKLKADSDGKVTYRARLLARGFNQREGIDYNETFSPVVRHTSLRLLLALAVELNLKITHLDVKTAFLNGILKEDVYMKVL